MEILTPVGRIVGGHPMISHPVLDDAGKPKMRADGVTPRTSTYIGLAIPKGQETDWKQTEWGQKIATVAATDWPNGEHGAATFAWKITDGDSTVPNKKGKKPCDKEGYPGHWVVNLSTALPVKCYHVGKYDPMQQIKDAQEIKPGDYGRVMINCKGNAPSQTPGVYLNPELFELSRAGELIVLDGGTSAADAFGGSAPTQPAIMGTAAAMNNTASSPPIIPAPDVLTPPTLYNVGGTNNYTAQQLLSYGWTQQQIDQL